MKKTTLLLLTLVMLLSVVPTISTAYAGYVVPNGNITMPKACPEIDGDIEEGMWSQPAHLNDATAGHFWASNPLTSEADLYFAYDNNGLYFAADITDNDASSGFIASTDYDDIDGDYGFNGDVMTLMLDPLGRFERTSNNPAWYNIGIYSDNEVRIYRSRVNAADITSYCSSAGAITDNGWKFEVFIPWSIIIADVSSASSGNISANVAQLTAENAISRCSAMYMDRMEGMTWGRYITVCDRTYDGYSGTQTNGTSAKSFGLKLVNGAAAHVHEFGDWVLSSQPTCTSAGIRTRSCLGCSKVETETVPPLGHGEYYSETVSAKCLTTGSEKTYCGRCNLLVSTVTLSALGHDFSDWVVTTQPTSSAPGLKRRECSRCDAYEEGIVSTIGAPSITADNYDVTIENESEIDFVRYASGILTTSSQIKNAADCCNINKAVIGANSVDGNFVWNMPTGGIYSFWVRKTDGTTYIMSIDLSNMEQELVSDGVTLTVKNLFGVSDFTIAKGNYNSYREVANHKIVTVTSAKIASKHDYTYVLSEPGVHTVCIRYNDPGRSNKILKINLSVTEPEFVADGLQLHIANLDGVRVIRSAYGNYNSSGEIKRATGARNFSASVVSNGGDPYTIQYSDIGAVTVSVEYKNGYCKLFNFDVTKKVPNVKVKGLSVQLSNLDGLYVIRYAKGVFEDGSSIKNATNSKYIRPSSVVNGAYTISGLDDNEVYTFLVQYTDNSKNIFTVTPKLMPENDEIANIGTERQLILEDYTIDFEDTNASLVYNSPTKLNSVFSFDQGYESTDAVYHNIVKDTNGTYRMYYKATSNIRRIAYITSTDGINWTRPNDGYSYNGHSSNIVTHDDYRPDNLFVFYDNNPACVGTRWKGIYGEWGAGLFCEYSPDGLSFFNNGSLTILGNSASTSGSFFDSLNTVYWDAAKGKYVAFVRGFHEGNNYNLSPLYVSSNGTAVTRDIRYSESTDFIHWSTPVPITYDDENDWQMYTNCVAPYFRAPQLYIGTPTRYRYVGGSSTPLTDVFLMSSRDLLHWDRTETPYMVPKGAGSSYKYGESGYPCIGLIQTGENEMSLYMKEPNNGIMKLYRYTLRLDGFRSANGSGVNDKLVTKYLQTDSRLLSINYSTEAGGSIRVTASDIYGNSVSTNWFSGDSCDYTVSFNDSLSNLSGGLIKLTFELNNAKLYSYKFN